MTIFITVEGIDGAGKSTHLEFIAKIFDAKSMPYIMTREPGGTELGEKIRSILLHDDMTVSTETLLMFSARNEHLQKKILPSINQGVSVICDRFTDASYAYQQGGKGIESNFIEVLEKLVHPELQPDLTFIFDIKPSIARSRISHERDLDKFERSSEEFFKAVRNNYLNRAKNNSRYCVIDSSQTIEKIQKEILVKLEEFI
jgi:dTMP kinase